MNYFTSNYWRLKKLTFDFCFFFDKGKCIKWANKIDDRVKHTEPAIVAHLIMESSCSARMGLPVTDTRATSYRRKGSRARSRGPLSGLRGVTARRPRPLLRLHQVSFHFYPILTFHYRRGTSSLHGVAKVLVYFCGCDGSSVMQTLFSFFCTLPLYLLLYE